MFEGYAGTQDEIEADRLRKDKEDTDKKAKAIISHLPSCAIDENALRTQLVATDKTESLIIAMQYLDTCRQQFKYYKKLIKMEIKDKKRLK